MKTGAYFLANDQVFDYAVAFLSSFRTSNPDVPLCMIPFSDNCERVKSLASQYDFTIFENLDVLKKCDEIAVRFHGQPWGHYRKLAAWSGPFDRFVYIDCDTIVLHPLEFIFAHLDEYGFITSHSDYPNLFRCVWRESVRECGLFTEQQLSFSANTGFIASRRGLLDIDSVELDIEATLEIAVHFSLEYAEQPLLNYLMVTSAHPYTSLFMIRYRTRDKTIPLERMVLTDFGRMDEDALAADRFPTLLIHWAGDHGTTPEDMPFYNLWKRYRDMHEESNSP
jgi:hypothetical protein